MIVWRDKMTEVKAVVFEAGLHLLEHDIQQVIIGRKCLIGKERDEEVIELLDEFIADRGKRYMEMFDAMTDDEFSAYLRKLGGKQNGRKD